MSTSLIGKALAFGSSEYRFESCVLNYMFLNKPAYIQNQISFALSQQNPTTKLKYTKQSLIIIRILHSIGCIHKFIILNKKHYTLKSTNIIISILLYKNTPFFKSFRLLSTPTKYYNITYKALKLLNISVGVSIIILSTSKGLLTHQQALRYKIGGQLLYIIS